MGFLTDIPDKKIPTANGKIIVNPAFDVVLEIQKMYREEISDCEKVELALSMLVQNVWNLKLFKPNEKVELLNDIYKKYIDVKKRPQIRKKSPNPILDFEEDGDYIYASFMQAYRMDLIDEQGRLPWKNFLFLFNGLSDDTKIKQVMRIREMEIPAFDGKNQKQIQEIQELKSYYALPIRGGGGQSGLDLLFSTLEGMAKH